MTYESIDHSIRSPPVFDTHTHLETGWRQPTQGLYARSFFDICRYFWFQRELEAAGYHPAPGDVEPDPASPGQAKELHEALRQVRNTTWARTVTQAMDELYGIRPDSVDRILELSQKMRENALNPTSEWGRAVCDKIGIEKTVIGPPNPEGEASVALIKDRTICVPALSVASFLKDLDMNTVDTACVETLKEQLKTRVAEFHADGIRTIRVAWPFMRNQTKATRKEFSRKQLRDKAHLEQYLGHFLFGLMEAYGFSAQIFFGMEKPEVNGLSDAPLVLTYAQNDTTRVTAMHNIFEMYLGINFELFCATELNSLDMVQAARIYPNVYPGGLWWFNFRRSVYEKNMQFRLEALPACRATFVASDARCIEWSYIKILLIKKIMAGFFHKQITDGWLDEDTALFTARCWLHDTAEKLYGS